MILPSPETAKAKGWTHQVQWSERGNPCFIRCKSDREAKAIADRLVEEGQKPTIIDLSKELRKH